MGAHTYEIDGVLVGRDSTAGEKVQAMKEKVLGLRATIETMATVAHCSHQGPADKWKDCKHFVCAEAKRAIVIYT